MQKRAQSQQMHNLLDATPAKLSQDDGAVPDLVLESVAGTVLCHGPCTLRHLKS